MSVAPQESFDAGCRHLPDATGTADDIHLDARNHLSDKSRWNVGTMASTALSAGFEDGVHPRNQVKDAKEKVDAPTPMPQRMPYSEYYYVLYACYMLQLC